MSVTRFQVVKVFSDATYLFYEHGVVWSGDEMNGTCVLYRPNGHVRELVSNSDGELEGMRATYHPWGSPRSFRHYRKGKLYGEAVVYDRTGVILSHVIYTELGEAEDFRPTLAKDYQGYVVCQADIDAERKYSEIGPRGWVEG